jgi:hypothetical protein
VIAGAAATAAAEVAAGGVPHGAGGAVGVCGVAEAG